MEGGARERDAEEMLVLGELTVRTAEFLDAAAGAYAFFAYAVSVPAVLLLVTGTVEALGGHVAGWLPALSALAGVALGFLLSRIVPRPAYRYSRRILGGPRGRRVIVFWLVFLAGFEAGSYLVLLVPGCVSVSWYGGLALALALESAALQAMGARRVAGAFVASSMVAGSFLPLVVLTCNVMVALASLMLSYLAGGSWALWRASKVFES